VSSLEVRGVPSFSKSPEVGEQKGPHWVVKAQKQTLTYTLLNSKVLHIG